MLETELTQTKNRLAKVEPQLKATIKQRDEYKEAYEQLKRKHQEVKDDLLATQRQHADAQRVVEQQKKDLRQKDSLLEEARARIIALVSQLQSVRDELMQKDREVSVTTFRKP